MDGGFLNRHGITHLIRDRSVTFGEAFDDVLQAAHVEPVLTPVAAPNTNAHIERWIGSCRQECLNHMWFLGDGALRRVMVEYIDYHNHHRPHQALGGQLPVPGPKTPSAVVRIRRRTRLGGLLAWYEREAA
jgi:putative transposase